MSLQLAFDLLNQSFKAAEIVDDEQVTPNRVDPEYRVWRDVVSDQIKDLRAMKENGQLERDDKYFGMDAPSGNRWYNFDLFGYLECATAGAFGGWEDGDDTGRILVSGQVSFIDENGNFDSRDARDIEQLTIEMPGITWEQFSEFIHCGRLYE